MDDSQQMRNVVEAALLTAGEPVAIGYAREAVRPRARHADGPAIAGRDRRRLSGRSVELVQVASGWRFQCKSAVQSYLTGSRRKSRRAIRAR